MKKFTNIILVTALFISVATSAMAAEKNHKAWKNQKATPIEVPVWIPQDVYLNYDPIYELDNDPVEPQSLRDSHIIPIILPDPEDANYDPKIYNNTNPALSPYFSKDIILEKVDRDINPSLTPYLMNWVTHPKIK